MLALMRMRGILFYASFYHFLHCVLLENLVHYANKDTFLLEARISRSNEAIWKIESREHGESQRLVCLIHVAAFITLIQQESCSRV